MSFSFSKRSLDNLKGVHPDLVKVAHEVLKRTPKDFIVIDGVRTIEEQKLYVAKGKSRTMNSKHLPQADGYSHAIDVVPYPVSWEKEDFKPIIDTFKEVSEELGVELTFGYDWGWDAPHIQLK